MGNSWRGALLNKFTVGDAIEYINRFPAGSVPMFLFSPPYNLGVSSGAGMRRATESGKWQGALKDGYAGHDDAMDPGDYMDWQSRVLLACWHALSETGAIYYNHKPRVQYGQLQTPLDWNPGLPVRQIVIWVRSGGINYTESAYCPTHEWIVIFAKPGFRLRDKAASGAGDVWRIPQEIGTWHPAPYPLELATRAIETVMPEFVVDPFCGRGTVAVAAQRLGIEWACNDLSEEYIRRAQEWFAWETERRAITPKWELGPLFNAEGGRDE